MKEKLNQHQTESLIADPDKSGDDGYLETHRMTFRCDESAFIRLYLCGEPSGGFKYCDAYLAIANVEPTGPIDWHSVHICENYKNLSAWLRMCADAIDRK